MSSSDDDFAVSVFGKMEDRQVARLQVEAEAEERWWIVMQPKVAVRSLPTTEGKPMCVLPAGSVVRAQSILHVGAVRWLVLHADDLPLLPKKKNAANTAAATDCSSSAAAASSISAAESASSAYMMIDGSASGLTRLLMVAPKAFDWEQVRLLPPKHRGEAARRLMIGDGAGSGASGGSGAIGGSGASGASSASGASGASGSASGGSASGGEAIGGLATAGELSDEYLDSLLNAYDAQQHASKGSAQAVRGTAEASGGVEIVESMDGLLDLSVSERLSGGTYGGAGTGAIREAAVAAEAVAAKPRSYEEIMRVQAKETRAERERAEREETERAAEQADEEAKKVFSRNARAHAGQWVSDEGGGAENAVLSRIARRGGPEVAKTLKEDYWYLQ